MLNFTAYQAVDEAVSLSDRSGRVRLDVAGPDRARFLHNLTTNEVKRLAVGHGCEAFITSPQGKTLAYIKMLVCSDSILICSDPGGLVLGLPHLQKYGVFDDIVLEDRSESTFEFHLAGPSAEELLRRAGGDRPAPVENAHVTTTIAECPLLVVRESPTGRPGLTLIGPRSAAARVSASLRTQGAQLGLAELDLDCFDVLRIEAGTPVFGSDVTERNLPQEVGRDDRAINFVKGCYLGQETVARIDAVGHVNQVMRGLRIKASAHAPLPGTALEAEGKRVGFVTSSAISPGWGAPIALAMIRNSHARAGTNLSLIGHSELVASAVVAEVSDLPMLPGHGQVSAP
jgi:folate-binding protein YgfZ